MRTLILGSLLVFLTTACSGDGDDGGIFGTASASTGATMTNGSDGTETGMEDADAGSEETGDGDGERVEGRGDGDHREREEHHEAPGALARLILALEEVHGWRGPRSG